METEFTIRGFSYLSSTIAETGMKLFKREFLPYNIVTPYWVNRMIEPAAIGGTVQAYRLGRFNHLYVYDINSSYPDVMRRFRYSFSLADKKVRNFVPRNPEELVKLINEGQKEAESSPLLRIDYRNIYLKLLNREQQKEVDELIKRIGSLKESVEVVYPAIKRKVGKNYVALVSYELPPEVQRVCIQCKGSDGRPTEYLSATCLLTGLQIKDLFEQVQEWKHIGARMEVHSVTEFYNRAMFQEYAQFLYERKTNAVSPVKDSYKLLLNTLSGKFGQKSKKTREVRHNKEYSLEGGGKSDADHIRKAVQILSKPYSFDTKDGKRVTAYPSGYVEETDFRDAFRVYSALIYAEITANGRHSLWEKMKIVGDNIGWEHILYVNTDSIVTDIPVDKYLRIGNGLGEFKLEYEGEGAIFGIGDYYVIDRERGIHLVLSGFPDVDKLSEDEKLTIINSGTLNRILRTTKKSMQKVKTYDFEQIRKEREINLFSGGKLRYIEFEGTKFGMPLERQRLAGSNLHSKKGQERKTKGKSVFSTRLDDSKIALNIQIPRGKRSKKSHEKR